MNVWTVAATKKRRAQLPLRFMWLFNTGFGAGAARQQFDAKKKKGGKKTEFPAGLPSVATPLRYVSTDM